jgi:uncharacterized membrane protein YhaH (DUF805 family)
VKRAHDRNMPLVFLMIFFAGSAALDLLAVMEMATIEDQPTIVATLIAVPFTILTLFLLVELGFRKGIDGPNQYGPDPLTNVFD